MIWFFVVLPLFFAERELLPELMENIHVVLFLVFTIFMLQILVLLFFAYRQGKKWHRAEKSLLKRGAAAPSGLNPQEVAEFEVIRTQFVFPITPRPGAQVKKKDADC
jgi:hypothetical protein